MLFDQRNYLLQRGTSVTERPWALGGSMLFDQRNSLWLFLVYAYVYEVKQTRIVAFDTLDFGIEQTVLFLIYANLQT